MRENEEELEALAKVQSELAVKASTEKDPARRKALNGAAQVLLKELSERAGSFRSADQLGGG